MRPESSLGDRNDYLIVPKKVSLKHRIFLSPFMKYVVPTVIAIALLMTAVYMTMYFVLKNSDDIWQSTCNIRASYRVNCFPGRSRVSYDECNEADCCWHDETQLCFHSIPARHGYTQQSNANSYQENEVLVPRRPTSPFGKKNAESLTLKVMKHSDPSHVEIVLKIGQTAETREKTNERRRALVNLFSNESIFTGVPVGDDLSEKLLDFLPKSAGRRTVNLQTDPESNMDVYVHRPEISVTVTRKGENNSLMSTARGPLILTESFWEFTLWITNSSVYGLNQLELNGTTNWIYDNENGTARLAFLGIDDNGEGTTCYVSHEGPMEIKVIEESNLIVLRGLSLPSEISINVFSGPTPLDAIRQLTKALREYEGQIDKIELPSLGLHVCPNEDSKEFIEPLITIIEDMRKNEAPWDSHCIHRDFHPTLGNPMDDKVPVVEKAMELLAKENEERTIVPHLSPMLSADKNELSLKLNGSSLLLSNSSGSYRGLYRKNVVFYPDWVDTRTHVESLTYLNDYVKNYGNSKLLYLRDSWPMDETKGHPLPNYPTFDYVPRALQNLMVNGTIPYNLLSSLRGKSHYTQHGSYSLDFRNFARELGESTSLVIRGLWGESGNSSWSALRAAILAGVGSGIVGQIPSPMYACGTGTELGPGDDNDQLCSRWYGASVAWPHILAIHSNLPEGKHLNPSSTSYVTKHLKLRTSLVTYANTILAQYYIDGSPILAPTSVHYPKDINARNKWNQFMWGHGILVGVVTLPKVFQVDMWIPGKCPWRHLNGGVEVYPTITGITSITAVEGQIVTLIQPGTIIPIHKKISMTSASTIKSELTLVANLACDDSNASGKIFYGSALSDGEFLNLTVNKTTLKIGNILRVKAKACDGYGTKILRQGTFINNIDILGNGTYTVDKNFCDVNDDSFEINFS